MGKYIGKRLLMMIPVILGISFLIFAIMNLTPGDPARLILGEYAPQEQVDLLREEMGLNDNFFVRYGRYIVDALSGDFGESYRTGQSVAVEIAARFPTTVKLASGAITLSILIGIPVGIISAVKQYSIIDGVSLISALLLTSMPNFWLGLMLLLLFSLKLGWFPTSGAGSMSAFVLPCITLAASTMAVLIRMTRSTMLEVIRQDYIRTAIAKGAKESRIIFKHALRNALLPVVTIIGINFGIQLGGSIVVENVFGMPGLGSLIVESVKMKDTPMVMAGIMFIAVVGSLVNLGVDILYMYIDPRIKSQYVRAKR